MKILLLDGYNLIYRARYSGMNKGNYSTIFNFFRGLRPLIEKFSPDKAYMVLEGKPVKRLEIDPDYKGQRTYHNKDNFNEQRNQIIDIMAKYYPIQILKHKNYECDDVIGHLSNIHKEKNDDVTIISSDTDFIQCINENVKLYNPVRKKFLEKPDYNYVLWKSLKGDPGDNIIGFNGIGDKKAQKLCKSKDSLDKFLLLEGNKEKLEKNISMIKLHDLTEDFNEVYKFNVIKQKNWKDLREVFSNYEFSSIVEKEKTWSKYINTFECLFKEIENDNCK